MGDSTEAGSAKSVAMLADSQAGTTLVIGAPYTAAEKGFSEGLVLLFQGDTSTRITGNDDGLLGEFVASAGDVNGDGAGDLVIGRKSQRLLLLAPFEDGRAIDMASSVIDLPGPVVSAGDLDGDGIGDLVGGDWYTPDWGNGFMGEVYVWRAPHGANLGAETADVTFSPEVVGKIGRDVSSAGDVDGDGVSDILVGGPYYSGDLSRQGVVYLLSDPPDGRIGAGDATARLYGGLDYEQAGMALDEVGDLDGDGYDDLVIGSATSFDYGNGHPDRWICASVVYGPVEGDVNLVDADARISASLTTDCWTYPGLAGLGDSDGDGLDDFVLGAPGALSPQGYQTGVVHLFYGPVNGALSFADADALFYDPQWRSLAGRALAGGDANGDGYGDLLMGVPDHQPGGAAYLFLNGP